MKALPFLLSIARRSAIGKNARMRSDSEDKRAQHFGTKPLRLWHRRGARPGTHAYARSMLLVFTVVATFAFLALTSRRFAAPPPPVARPTLKVSGGLSPGYKNQNPCRSPTALLLRGRNPSRFRDRAGGRGRANYATRSPQLAGCSA